MKADTISQEFSLAAIGILLIGITLCFIERDLAVVPAGVGLGLWLAAMWCDLRGV